nr:DMT family transporter [Candidatus Sigynarchaeota archaeon]
MRDTIKGHLLSFSGVFCWSFSEIIVWLLGGQPGSIGNVGSVSLSFYRFFFGGVFMFIILAARKDLTGIRELLRHDKWLLFLSSVVGLGFSNIIYFFGIKLTEPHVGAALYTSYALFIGIYSIFILNERSNIPMKIAGFVIGLAGTFILLTNFDLALIIEPGKILGNILLVIAGAIWGFYSVLGKKIMKRNPEVKNVDVKLSTLSFFLACIPAVITLPFVPEASDFLQHTAAEWILIAIIAIVSTAIGIYLFYKGVKIIDVTYGISYSLLKPVIATVFAFFLLARIIPPAMFVSVPLVSVAVLLINRKPRKPAIQPEKRPSTGSAAEAKPAHN